MSKLINRTKNTRTYRKRNKVEDVYTETGEVSSTEPNKTGMEDNNFTPMWMHFMFGATGWMMSKKLKVFTYILLETDELNQFVGSMRSISENTSVSLTVVKETIDKLKESNFLRLKSASVYMINPDIISVHKDYKRLELSKEYLQLQKG